MTSSFNLISFIAFCICLQSLWELVQSWASFWDDKITPQDKELAQRLALFGLIPLGVLFHEIGHSLATWQVGGTVLSFNWLFYWGYIIPAGDFSQVESWWISLSGNLVSVGLGLLPIPFIPSLRKRIIGETLYYFACAESIYSLVGYPVMSFAMRGGDWVRIYDFSVQPYASIVAIGHIGLLIALWRIYNSEKVLFWRLASHAQRIETWKLLRSNWVNHPNDIQETLNLAYFLLSHNEPHEAKKVVCQIAKMVPNDSRIKIFYISIDCAGRSYRRAAKSARQLLKADLPQDEQLRLYCILCISFCNLRQLQDSLSYANQGLAIDPCEYRLRWHRSFVYLQLGQLDQAKADMEIALENAPDQESSEELKRWLGQLG
jgi:hypothetical protein